jgi:exosome complex RNA-binding protein Rrp4
MDTDMTTFCVPGDLIKEFNGSEEVGGGLYLHDGKLRSYLAGEIQVTDLGGFRVHDTRYGVEC